MAKNRGSPGPIQRRLDARVAKIDDSYAFWTGGPNKSGHRTLHAICPWRPNVTPRQRGRLSVCLSFSGSLAVFLALSLCPSVLLSFCLSVCLSSFLSVCLSVFRSLSADHHLQRTRWLKRCAHEESRCTKRTQHSFTFPFSLSLFPFPFSMFSFPLLFFLFPSSFPFVPFHLPFLFVFLLSL